MKPKKKTQNDPSRRISPKIDVLTGDLRGIAAGLSPCARRELAAKFERWGDELRLSSELMERQCKKKSVQRVDEPSLLETHNSLVDEFNRLVDDFDAVQRECLKMGLELKLQADRFLRIGRYRWPVTTSSPSPLHPN